MYLPWESTFPQGNADGGGLAGRGSNQGSNASCQGSCLGTQPASTCDLWEAGFGLWGRGTSRKLDVGPVPPARWFQAT